MMMSGYLTIARPYAKAAFEYACEHEAIADWGLFLQRLDFVVRDERAADFLSNPQILKQQKVEFLEFLAGDKISPEQKHFLKILAQYGRILCLPALADLYDQYAKKQQNLLDVEVSTPYPLDESEKQNLQKALEIRLGKSIAMSVIEDKDLIGGAVIRAGDFVIDGSIRAKLKRLRKLLTR